MRVILLTGPIGAGKTTFAQLYSEDCRGKVLSTSALITNADIHFGLEKPKNRVEKQRIGDELDETTDGAWIRDAAKTAAKGVGLHGTLIVDCVRRSNQIKHCREEWGTDVIVIGIRTSVLTEHLAARGDTIQDKRDLIAALQHPTERDLPMDQADIIIDNTRYSSMEALHHVRPRK